MDPFCSALNRIMRDSLLILRYPGYLYIPAVCVRISRLIEGAGLSFLQANNKQAAKNTRSNDFFIF